MNLSFSTHSGAPLPGYPVNQSINLSFNQSPNQVTSINVNQNDDRNNQSLNSSNQNQSTDRNSIISPSSLVKPINQSINPQLASVFEDLNARFFLNLPESELESWDRLFYQLQQAHWFYCDFYVDAYPPPNNSTTTHSPISSTGLPNLSLRDFCRQFMQFCPILINQLEHFDQFFTSFTAYIGSIPVCGVILLNQSINQPIQHPIQVLMVRTYKSHSWGFPRGKLDHDETEEVCAQRECQEEVGYELSMDQLKQNDSLTAIVNGKTMKMFIVPSIDQSTKFETRTRKEISEIAWIDIGQIQYKSNQPTNQTEKRNFYMALPFMGGLRRWIGQNCKIQKPSKKPSVSQPVNPSNGVVHSEPISIVPSVKSNKPPVHASSVPNSTIEHIYPSCMSYNNQSINPSNSQSISQSNNQSNNSSKRQPKHSRAVHSTSAIDANNTLTFATPVNQSNNRSNNQSLGGWSAEDMFAVNETKFGIRSARVEEKLEVPENFDEMMEKLGLKLRRSNNQSNTQSNTQSSNQNNNQVNNQANQSNKSANKRSNNGQPPRARQNNNQVNNQANNPAAVQPNGQISNQSNKRIPHSVSTPSNLTINLSINTNSHPTNTNISINQSIKPTNPYQKHTIREVARSATPPSYHSATQPHSAGYNASTHQYISQSPEPVSMTPQAINQPKKASIINDFKFDLADILQPLSMTG